MHRMNLFVIQGGGGGGHGGGGYGGGGGHGGGHGAPSKIIHVSNSLLFIGKKISCEI